MTLIDILGYRTLAHRAEKQKHSFCKRLLSMPQKIEPNINNDLCIRKTKGTISVLKSLAKQEKQHYYLPFASKYAFQESMSL